MEKSSLTNEEETCRQRSKRASQRHLKDLINAHGHPPEDVKIKRTSVPRRIEPPVALSYHTSPAELCSDIGDPE
jgi:hypothetical protein